MSAMSQWIKFLKMLSEGARRDALRLSKQFYAQLARGSNALTANSFSSGALGKCWKEVGL
jgi:hypothetical protein